MKFSENWLRSLVDLKAPRAELAHRLTMAGLEVEGIEAYDASLAGVVVAEIVGAEKHPQADKLQVCRVNAGGEELQIVCGAPNARVGLKAPVAMVGAKLPGGIIGNFDDDRFNQHLVAPRIQLADDLAQHALHI